MSVRECRVFLRLKVSTILLWAVAYVACGNQSYMHYLAVISELSNNWLTVFGYIICHLSMFHRICNGWSKNALKHHCVSELHVQIQFIFGFICFSILLMVFFWGEGGCGVHIDEIIVLRNGALKWKQKMWGWLIRKHQWRKAANVLQCQLHQNYQE